jgi:outer membrane protein
MLHRFTRTLAVIALATLPLISPAPAASAEGRIAVVDVQSAVMQTEDGLRAQATLKKLFDKIQRDLAAKKEELERMKDDIEKRQVHILSHQALARRMEDWQRRFVESQTLLADNNEQLLKKQHQLGDPIKRKVFRVISRLAKKNGYDIVIDSAAAPYVRQDLDLTDQVIQMYNSGGEGGGDAPAEGGGDKPAEPAAPPAPTPPAP